MHLQRLIADDSVGFNYDYMGSAEYENGATKTGRMALAELFLRDKLQAKAIEFIEVIGSNASKPVSVVAMGTAGFLEQLGNRPRITVTKETFRTGNPNIIGWLNVAWPDRDIDPLLMVRLSEEASIKKRVEQFLKDPIAHLREQQAD